MHSINLELSTLEGTQLELSTLEGTQLESMYIQASENTLSSSDSINFSYVMRSID